MIEIPEPLHKTEHRLLQLITDLHAVLTPLTAPKRHFRSLCLQAARAEWEHSRGGRDAICNAFDNSKNLEFERADRHQARLLEEALIKADLKQADKLLRSMQIGHADILEICERIADKPLKSFDKVM